MSVPVYLGIGSNVHREQNICHALDQLLQDYGALRVSSVYESAAFGFDGAPFFNLVAAVTTDEPVAEVMQRLRSIENACGRRRDVPRFSDRTLDIDLLLYGDAVGELDGVTLPRGDITEYAFVLWPMAEIAGELSHPIEKLSYAELWERFDPAERHLAPVSFDWHATDLSAGFGVTEV